MFHFFTLFLIPMQNDDGTWTGVIGQLHRKEIDLSPISFTRTKIRSDVVDFALPITTFHHRFFIQNPSSTFNWWAYIEPLTLTVWGAVGIFTLILSPVLTLSANTGTVIQGELHRYVENRWENGNLIKLCKYLPNSYITEVD